MHALQLDAHCAVNAFDSKPVVDELVATVYAQFIEDTVFYPSMNMSGYEVVAFLIRGLGNDSLGGIPFNQRK